MTLGESLALQHRLLVTKFTLNLNKKLTDTSVPVEKIKWFKLADDGQSSTFLKNAENWIRDPINAEDIYDGSELWNAFQDGIVYLPNISQKLLF